MAKSSAKQYQVKKVLDKRTLDGVDEYKVLWKGYFQHQSTWQPEDCLKSSKKLIKMYEKESQLKKRKMMINQKAIQQYQIELNQTEYKLIKNFKELQLLLNINKPDFHSPIPFVKMGKQKQAVITFESLISRPPNQIVKVQRFDQVQGCWKQKLETCSQIIVKTATLQRKELVQSEQKIQIDIISVSKNEYIVYFQFRQKRYKCQLKYLRLIKPHQIIQFLLQRYDPADHKITKSKEIFNYLKNHPQINGNYFK